MALHFPILRTYIMAGVPDVKITDVNDFCLEKVFRSLNFNDLVNIAVTNTRCLPSATYVYRRQHADKLIRFDSSASTNAMFQNFMNILNAFGDNIRKLCVVFNVERGYNERDQAIFRKINEKCSKSVVELRLSFVRKDMIITKPFVHLRKLMIANSYFTDSMMSIAQSAPNLASFELHSVENVFNDTFVNLHIPLLVHFGNFNQIVNDPEREMESLQNFRRFVNVNKQITSFGFGSNELSYMLKYKQFRQQFFNEMHPNVPCPDKRNLITYLFPFEPIYLQNWKHLHVRLEENVEFLRILRHRLIDFPNVPFEHVELHADGLPLEVMDFVIQFREVKKLQYFIYNRLNAETIDAFARGPSVLRKLVDLEFTVLNGEEITSLETSFVKSFDTLFTNGPALQRVTIGFEISRPIDEARANDAAGMALKNQPLLLTNFKSHVPANWHIGFKTEIIEIQRRQCTENAFILYMVLTENSN